MADDAFEGGFDDQRITALDALLGAAAGVEARLHCVFAHHDLSGVEVDVLLRLARDPDHALRMGDIAARSWLSTSGVTRVTDRLETHGFVRRESCPSDRRALMVVLTEQGGQKLRALLPELLPALDACFADLGNGGLDALIDALDEVCTRTRETNQRNRRTLRDPSPLDRG